MCWRIRAWNLILSPPRPFVGDAVDAERLENGRAVIGKGARVAIEALAHTGVKTGVALVAEDIASEGGRGRGLGRGEDGGDAEQPHEATKCASSHQKIKSAAGALLIKQ